MTADHLRTAAAALHRAAELLTPADRAYAYVIVARDAVAAALAAPAGPSDCVVQVTPLPPIKLSEKD